ncbi:MAG: hypothetical protein GY742_20760 [Hyphomicrobiales bacterium]|nr:hypothetical protein [Hyphomicrobiales bacterium]
MTKMLKTIRFDDSDKKVFDCAAEEGEWAISSAFQFCDKQWDDIDGKPRQAFNNGFLGLSSFGYSTFGCVTGISSSQNDQAQMQLARYLFEEFGAPDLEAAMAAALEEISYINELCADVNPGKVFAVRREFNASGRINESFHVVDVEDDGCVHHGNIWDIA